MDTEKLIIAGVLVYFVLHHAAQQQAAAGSSALPGAVFNPYGGRPDPNSQSRANFSTDNTGHDAGAYGQNLEVINMDPDAMNFYGVQQVPARVIGYADSFGVLFPVPPKPRVL